MLIALLHTLHDTEQLQAHWSLEYAQLQASCHKFGVSAWSVQISYCPSMICIGSRIPTEMELSTQQIILALIQWF